ncbi:MAG: T9SS type A sorting domain-containing protein [Bacteroidales bacterium]|jgi:hypothetical protein|nr:T9SS type A sorting domain-containing protein [Bacteroidales bacterium]
MKIGLVLLFCLFSLFGFSQITDFDRISSGNIQRETQCVISNLPNDITICENEAAEFQVSANNFNDLTWYSSENHTTPIGYGAQFNTGILSESQTYNLQANCPFPENQLRSIETLWRGENGKDGVMFSLNVKKTVSLQSIDIHMKQARVNCHVFMINGVYDMFSNNPAAWTPIFDDMIDGKGKSEPVTIDIQDVDLAPGVYGFYVSLENDDLLYYSTGTSVYEDDFLRISNGRGVTWPFSYLCGDRSFNGRLNYAVGERPKSIQYEIHANVAEKANALSVYFVGNHFSVNQDGAFVWYQNGKEILNENQSTLYPPESGVYTVAKQIGQCVGYESNPVYFAEPDIDDSPMQAEFYPNPVQKILYVNTHNCSSGLLQISDARGSILHEENFSGEQTLNINLSDFNPGQYSVSLISGQARFSQMIIKQ